MEGSIQKRPLTKLASGYCEDQIVVKVDRIVFKEELRFPHGPSRPMKELVAIHLVVFDDTLARFFIVMEDGPIFARFAHMFAETRTYKISNFLVCVNLDPDRLKYHIKLMHTSVVENVVVRLPEHAFDLITVPHVTTGVLLGRGLVDVCGFLVFVYEPGMGEKSGCFSREVVVLLEDSGVLAVGGTKVLPCTMRDACADNTMNMYAALRLIDPVFVVIQYAMVSPTPEGEFTVTSYYNATRVFFNPTFPELDQQRIAMLGRMTPPDSSSFLPIV